MSPRNRIQYSIYIILIICRNPVYAEDTMTYKITDEVLKCSGLLAVLINKVCDNVFKIVKRDTSILMEKLAPKSLQDKKAKQRIVTEERWRRIRRQVATECCDRPCTLGNLIMYCPEDAKLLRENPDLFQ